MSTSEGTPGERVKDARFTEDPRLLAATPEQRANWRVAGGGFGIHWPVVDEDLSTEGLLRSAPAPRRSAPEHA